jgi:hypothetical protein
LKKQQGEQVCSEERAETFAKYLQDVQWQVRPATLIDDSPKFPQLDVDLGPITLKNCVQLFVA